MAGSVIQGTGTVKFEDGLSTGVLPVGFWCHFATALSMGSSSIHFLGMGAVKLSYGPCLTKFQSTWFDASVIFAIMCC